MRLVITDNGDGFSFRILNRAFEPYAMIKAKGIGLGLAMVKKIMGEHGACIELCNRQSSATSGTLGVNAVGVQVSILFVELAQRGRQSCRTWRKSMAIILVVGDKIGIQELLSGILGNEGRVVEVTENAQRAREYHTSATPNLALLDI